MDKRYNLLKTIQLLTIFILLCVFFLNLDINLQANEEEPEEAEVSGEEEAREEKELVISFEDVQWQGKDRGSILIVECGTNLPDEARVWVFIKRRSYYITGTGRMTEVKDGKFSVKLGPFKEEFYPGIYIVEAAFMPERQKTEILALMNQEWIEDDAVISYKLQIGEAKNIVEVQTKICEQIKGLLNQVQDRYEELDATYEKHKEEFSKSEWHNWSKKWQVKLDKLDGISKRRNKGKIVPLFPSLEGELDGAIGHMQFLKDLYLRKLEGKGEGIIPTDELKSMIDESLLSVKGGVEVDYIPESEEPETEPEPETGRVGNIPMD